MGSGVQLEVLVFAQQYEHTLKCQGRKQSPESKEVDRLFNGREQGAGTSMGHFYFFVF